MNSRRIILNGSSLTTRDIYCFARDPKCKIVLDKKALSNVKKSADFVAREMNKKVIYGVNTGFGPMASRVIGKTQFEELQKNLLRSHAVGLGSPIKEEYVLATMLVRLNMFLKGYSGVSEALLLQLKNFLNYRIIPVIPEHGAVGTSGDLVQLAHIALALIGEGEVIYKGRLLKTKIVLKKTKLKPYSLKPKEGLALINGTSLMAGIAALLCEKSARLLSLSARGGALSLELVDGYTDGISQRLHSVRPHRGQLIVAKTLRELTKKSRLIRDRETLNKEISIKDDIQELSRPVQEVYSIRCIPQILGPILDTLLNATNDTGIEINSVTDNPIIDWKDKKFLHGGNFHGDYIAVAMDKLRASLAKLTILSERRTNYFLNHNINKKFPPFLNLKNPGLTLGLQGLQFVATSTTAQNQTLAYPHSVHSISTNADNQDVVSMGSDSALLTAKVLENAYIVLGIELIVLLQAVDATGVEKKLSTEGRRMYKAFRKTMPVIKEDNYSLRTHILKFLQLLEKDESFSAIF